MNASVVVMSVLAINITTAVVEVVVRVSSLVAAIPVVVVVAIVIVVTVPSVVPSDRLKIKWCRTHSGGKHEHTTMTRNPNSQSQTLSYRIVSSVLPSRWWERWCRPSQESAHRVRYGYKRISHGVGRDWPHNLKCVAMRGVVMWEQISRGCRGST